MKRSETIINNRIQRAWAFFGVPFSKVQSNLPMQQALNNCHGKRLRYWHRPAKQQVGGGSPFLFFHGMWNNVFLFENKPISYALCFDALSEEGIMYGVLEAIHQHLDTTSTKKILPCVDIPLGRASSLG